MSMMKREPNLELLLRGDVLALSSLHYASQRQAMLEALHDILGERYGQRDGTDPGIALIEALAAGLDVLGLYHDRFLTESKLGSAVLIQSVARLAEAVGYVPSPRLAARALQFFEARFEAILPRGTRVAGKRPDAPGNVVFETTRSLSIGPAFNRMPVSPLITRHGNASRAVIELTTAPDRDTFDDLMKIDRSFATVFDLLNQTMETGQPTPRDDFHTGFLAMVNGLFGLELARIEEVRDRSLALQRGLRASYDPSTTFLHAATQVRHLRSWRPLGSWPDGTLPGPTEGPELVVFELAEQPILHYPDAAVPGGLRSSLEVFVFEGKDDPGPPSRWSREDAWTEVPDFAASEASDRHYRTFVDDRLYTYLVLRRRLGHRVLLSDDALCRVFVRYTPAVGTIESSQDSDGLDPYLTFELDKAYFTSSLVCPALELSDGNSAKVGCGNGGLTWAVTAEPLDLRINDQILIDDTEHGRIFIRTLTSIRGRYISWASPTSAVSERGGPAFEMKLGRGPLPSCLLGDPDSTNPHEQYDSLDGCFTAEKTQLIPLRDAASGQYFPFWEELYNRIEVQAAPAAAALPGVMDNSVIVPRSSTFLFLEDTSQVKPGDFFLIGAREEDETHWREAEVVQAQEVHGGVVRLRSPTANQYPDPKHGASENANVRVLAVPLVASVYYGDRFTQTIRLEPHGAPVAATDTDCRPVIVDARRINPETLRSLYGWKPHDIADAYTNLFLAVAGESRETGGTWSVRVDMAPTRVREHVSGFVNNNGAAIGVSNFKEAADTIVLEMDELWKSVDPQGQIDLYARLYHDNEWSGDQLEVFPEAPDLWLELAGAPPLLLGPGHRLTLECHTEARIVKAEYEAGRYHIESSKFDIEKITSPGVQWKVTSSGVRWTEHVASGDSVQKDHQFHLAVIEFPETEDEETGEVEYEIRLTVTNDSLAPGDEFRVLESEAGEPLGTIMVIKPKRENSYYVIAYDGDDVDDLPEAPDGALVWADSGVWTSRDESLEVSRMGEELWLELAGSPFLDAGYALTLEIAREVRVEATHPREPRYRLMDPGFGITKVKARGLRWTHHLDAGQDPTTDDDFGLERRSGDVQLTVKADYLGQGDELELRLRNGTSDMARIIAEKGSDGYYVLQCSSTLPVSQVSEVIVRRVRIRSGFYVQLELPAEQARLKPWVLTFEKSAPLASSTLVYSTATDTGAGVEIVFKADKIALLLERYKAAESNDPRPSIHVHEDKKGELGERAYSEGPLLTDGQNDRNFLTSNAPLGIDVLLVKKDSEIFSILPPEGRSILICDKRRLPGSDRPSQPGEPVEVEDAAFAVINGLNTYFKSVVFNSGNFIPVSSAQLGENTVDSSLHLTLIEDDRETQLCLVRDLANIDLTQKQFAYNVNKTQEGVFTINILINKAGAAPSEIKVEVKYAATRAADSDSTSDKIYEFETEVKPWDPSTQLVLVDSGELESGDYLFLRTGTPELAWPIQWTRVQRIHGRVVSVTPALSFQPRATYCYSLHGLARLPEPQTLDPEYYKLLSEAVLDASISNERSPTGDTHDASSRSYSLALGDQLPLDPLVNTTLLESLIPGDHLLIWDERWREAWRSFRAQSGGRQSGEWQSGIQTDAVDWFDWPDYQHEAIVKSVDAAIGLVVLDEPLPARFRVVYEHTSADAPQDSALCPRSADYQSLRVLPYYRAPFQGERELVAIGSGNQAKKFPRYLTEVDSDIGLASVPLDVNGTLASNIEVLAREPRSNEWSRWTQFQTLETAKRGDAALTLGVELSGEQPNTLALSVGFGDGRNGRLLPTGENNVYIRTTRVGRWDEHLYLYQRRELQILQARSRSAPFTTPGTGAVQPNLWLLIELGGHAQWRPTQGGWPWWPAMTIQLTREETDAVSGAPCCREIIFREITCEEARGGHDGIWVSGYRPGVVQVFFFWPTRLEPDDVEDIEVWAEPQSRVWSLDQAFYDAVANPERTPGPGSPAQIALLETRGLRVGSLLAFARDGDGGFELATVKEVQHDTYSATLAAPLERAYPIATSALRGNLVHVEEGESEKQHIGSGDGKTANMRIPLHLRKPVMYSQDESSGEPVPGVEILVDGVVWERRDDLSDSGPRDRVYRLDRDPAGGLTVELGDGRNGAIPARGTDNIEAILRFGSDQPANVDAGVIDKLRDGNLAVISTRNLLAAAGGRLAESPSEARDTLRQRGLPYTRAITAEDVARLALEVGEVIHARVDPTADPSGIGGLVRVVVALEQRRQPDPTILAEIHQRLLPRMPVTAGARLEINGAEQRPVHIVASDIVVETGYDEGDVLARLNKAFAAEGDGFFAPRHWSIGRALRLGDLYEAIFAVPGVSAARVRWMSLEKPPLDLPPAAGETVEVGPRGVIRCDNHPKDPERGSVRFDLGGGRA